MRVKRAPWLVIGVWLSTLLLALPLAIVLQEQIGAHLGASMAAQAAADGRQLRLVERVPGADLRRRRQLRAGDSRLRGGDEEPQRGRRRDGAADGDRRRGRDAHAACRCSWSAACSIGWRAIAPSARARSSPRAASTSSASSGWASIAAAVYWVLFVPYHAWLFDAVYPALIGERHGRANGVLHPRSASTPLRACRCCSSTSCSTTPRFAPSSRIAAA